MKHVLSYLFFMILIPQWGFSQVHFELEHTFMAFEGSSWGTEGLLKKRLQIDEKNLPALFKIPLVRSKPSRVDLGQIKRDDSYTLYMNDQVDLYRDLTVCTDLKGLRQESGFRQAEQIFLQRLMGPVQESNFSMKYKEYDRVLSAGSQDFSVCDVIVTQPTKMEYPFDRLPPLSKEQGIKAPETVLGLYYRFSEQTIPVIVFHPEIELRFDDAPKAYLSWSPEGRLLTDGRVLFFHELGHLFGLAHIQERILWRDFSIMSVMGSAQNNEISENRDSRFSYHLDIWRYWNLQQTSLYRTLWWKWRQGRLYDKDHLSLTWPQSKNQFCLYPGENVLFKMNHFSTVNMNDTERALDLLVGHHQLGSFEFEQDSEKNRFPTWSHPFGELFTLLSVFYDESRSWISPPLVLKELDFRREDNKFYTSVLGQVDSSFEGTLKYGLRVRGKRVPFLAVGSLYMLQITSDASSCFN